jgi:hypothetical protein
VPIVLSEKFDEEAAGSLSFASSEGPGGYELRVELTEGEAVTFSLLELVRDVPPPLRGSMALESASTVCETWTPGQAGDTVSASWRARSGREMRVVWSAPFAGTVTVMALQGVGR